MGTKIKMPVVAACQYNPSRADPSNQATFLATCASCISASMTRNKRCIENSWTFRTRCDCENNDYAMCTCKRQPSEFAMFIFFILPLVCIAMICSARQCFKWKFCPLNKVERDYKQWLKKEKTKEKGDKEDGDKDTKKDKKSKSKSKSSKKTPKKASKKESGKETKQA